MTRNSPRLRSFVKQSLFLLLGIALTAQAANATTVRVSTTLGDFSIELFDDITPVTVANFLAYVNSGRFNGTVFHRSESNFVIQGGWLTFDPASSTLNQIDLDPTIQNEFNVSNTRGTVAMAKVGGDPNSASSQWFVNLADNSANLDNQNGGFTAFGRVIGDGMTVVDNIAAQPVFTVAGLNNFPLINYNGGTVVASNFVNVIAVVEEVASAPAPNYFDEASGQLRVTVDAGTSGLATLGFSIAATSPSVVVQLDLSSVEVLSAPVENMATFDAATGVLLLPELSVSGTVAFRNLRFVLSDSAQLLFTLESFDQI